MLNNEFINYLSRLNVSALTVGLFQSLRNILFLHKSKNLSLSTHSHISSAIDNLDSDNKYLRVKSAYHILAAYYSEKESEIGEDLSLHLCEPGMIIKALSSKVKVEASGTKKLLESIRDRIHQGKLGTNDLGIQFYEENVLGHVLGILHRAES